MTASATAVHCLHAATRLTPGSPVALNTGELFDRLFGAGAAAYVLGFAVVVYGATASAQAKLGVSLLACALPALLSTELASGDHVAGDALANAWLQEFVGTAVMVALTCMPGALLGHLGYQVEWVFHWLMMMAADSLTGGNVNPLVSTTMVAAGRDSTKEWVVKVAAQCGGAVVGWKLLIAAGEFMVGDVGGPSPDEHLPLFYVFWSECLGGATLCLAVWAFATTSIGEVYAAKMGLINVTLRTIIVYFGATGPAVNPALAFGYDFAVDGSWPTMEAKSPSYVAYWAGGMVGAAVAGLVWKVITQKLDEKAQIGAGVALIGACLAAWIFVLAVEAQAISDDTAYGKAMAARHPVTKLFGRKPKAHREL